MSKSGSVFGGTLLVTGTSIGGGMLALPVLTSLGGFIPSLVIYLLCWLFMASTGLLFLEVCQWMNKETNIVTMAERTLGKPGRLAAWILYLFLFYCLTLAYVVGCGDLFSQLFGGAFSPTVGALLFVVFFAPFVYAGTKTVGKINVGLMFGLAVSYLAFVVLGFKYVDTSLLWPRSWALSLYALPIAFTAFAYQGIIPTLFNYMHHNVKKTRLAIMIGSFIPLVAYVIWQWLILGIVPTYGPHGLAEALEKGHNAVKPLDHFISNPAVPAIGEFFAFFALTTSFFGVTLGLLDFLSDGLNIVKNEKGKIFLCLMIFIPPLIVAAIHPGIFLEALSYAGGFGCAILLGLLPIMMVWRGRYYLGFKSEPQLPGGRIVLSLLALFVFFELACEITHLFRG